MNIVRRVIADNQIMPDDIPRIEETLFFEGAKRRLNLESFVVLMLFATVIATYGIISDSTATVVGAMLIAPLMTPIMGIAAALVMGRTTTAGHSLLIVLVGILIAISVSWLIGSVYRTSVISMTTNGQIAARTAPRLTDLAAALASGAVGAFAMSRKDVANTLPGVAIAIALVPPLAVVGVAISQGAWHDATGAFLLFLTNFLSILLAGGSVFALLGLANASLSQQQPRERRRSFLLIIVSVVLVIVPLAGTSARAVRSSNIHFHTNRASREWLEETEYEVVNVVVDGNEVLLRITGDGPLPPSDEFTAILSDRMKMPLTIRLRVIPAQEQRLTIGQ